MLLWYDWHLLEMCSTLQRLFLSFSSGKDKWHSKEKQEKLTICSRHFITRSEIKWWTDGASSSSSITDDQLRRSVLNKQKAKDKLSKKPGKSDSVHCVCSSTEDVGHMVECESCCRWSHSKWVGLTFSIAPSYPFVCPFCLRSLFSHLSAIESKIADLSTRVSSLSTTRVSHWQKTSRQSRILYVKYPARLTRFCQICLAMLMLLVNLILGLTLWEGHLSAMGLYQSLVKGM